MAKNKKSGKKLVYFFGEGDAKMKDLLGGKGANLNEMTNLGIPVPPGFTITTECCNLYYDLDRKWPEELQTQMDANIAKLEKATGKCFGDKNNTLLVSVRSGAKFSMPGMMDTILNLGLSLESVETISNITKNPRFAWDSYRRFIQMFGSVVMGIGHDHFEEILDSVKHKRKVKLDTDLDHNDLKEVALKYREMIKEVTKKDFPNDPKTQLRMSIDAVFNSWNNERAITYRRLNDIPGDLGTAVNIQAMVFGNMGDDSGTGVAFTRNPSTGENLFYGEYLMNAQGEDVVAGIRTPQKIDNLAKVDKKSYNQLVEIRKKLEKHYKDMQDIEFTIEKGKLYMLQTRNGKRTAAAAIRIAVNMVSEGLIKKDEALLRVDPNSLNQLLHKRIDTKEKLKILGKGLPASPGAAVGEIVFTAERAHDWAEEGKNVILVRTETSPEDIEGMHAAKGILTSRGGMTSHAAVVARGMGKCCVAGCEAAKVNEKEKTLIFGDRTFKEGNIITLNGSTGEVIEGAAKLIDPEMTGEFSILMKWADDTRTLNVRTNADTPHDAKVARGFGAEGIGLCRTEHMFFEGERIKAVREMILSETLDGRKKALAKLMPMQKGDFSGLFKEMKDLPVTIRLLDPPLHEFLPQDPKDIKDLAKEMNVSEKVLKDKIDSLHEFNPMLGHRGCRLGIVYPEITEMQAQAIFEAACELKKKGQDIVPEVMIPLVGDIKEFRNQKDIIVKVAEETIAKYKVQLKYMVGTMIEVPRGALMAGEIAKEAEFFSFGTNDLTQMTLGISRDDAGKFIPKYIELGIYEKDPFAVLDQTGVGQLVQMAAKRGREARKNLKLGICGEHGGDPSSVEFCHRAGLNYVSCSPFRVPIARLAAAHAKIKETVKSTYANK
ncbi:MAG: pyruvate, phosphate dikinase [Nanoarchaeota archaeon]|nr:pyruvate, phosphate dikinase [Nanoarchaeota archaeon]